MNSALVRADYAQVVGSAMRDARTEGCDGYWLHELYPMLDLDVAKEDVSIKNEKLKDVIREIRAT